MIEARQARAREAEWPTFNLGEWVRSWLSSLSARFGSWQDGGDEEDELTWTADPQLVAALEFVASLMRDEPEGKR